MDDHIIPISKGVYNPQSSAHRGLGRGGASKLYVCWLLPHETISIYYLLSYSISCFV